MKLLVNASTKIYNSRICLIVFSIFFVPIDLPTVYVCYVSLCTSTLYMYTVQYFAPTVRV